MILTADNIDFWCTNVLLSVL